MELNKLIDFKLLNVELNQHRWAWATTAAVAGTDQFLTFLSFFLSSRCRRLLQPSRWKPSPDDQPNAQPQRPQQAKQRVRSDVDVDGHDDDVDADASRSDAGRWVVQDVGESVDSQRRLARGDHQQVD